MVPTPRPTEAELEILRTLWEIKGPATVKEVFVRYAPGRDLGYTAVLKLMQTMHDKGLLQRDASERAHRYWPTQPKTSTQARLLGDFMERVFGGSARDLVQMALSGEELSDEERKSLQALIEGKG